MANNLEIAFKSEFSHLQPPERNTHFIVKATDRTVMLGIEGRDAEIADKKNGKFFVKVKNPQTGESQEYFLSPGDLVAI